MVVVRGGASAVPEYPVAIQVAIQVAVHNGYSRLLKKQRCGSVTKNRSGVGFAPLNGGKVDFGLGENENR